MRSISGRAKQQQRTSMRIPSSCANKHSLDLLFPIITSRAIQVGLQRFLHAAFHRAQLEMIPRRAKRHERFDLREGRGAANVHAVELWW